MRRGTRARSAALIGRSPRDRAKGVMAQYAQYTLGKELLECPLPPTQLVLPTTKSLQLSRSRARLCTRPPLRMDIHGHSVFIDPRLPFSIAVDVVAFCSGDMVELLDVVADALRLVPCSSETACCIAPVLPKTRFPHSHFLRIMPV